MLNCHTQVEAKTASTNFTWLNSYLHISIRIFCTLFICFVLDGPLQSICLRTFCSKHSAFLKARTHEAVDFTMLTYFTSNLHSVKL